MDTVYDHIQEESYPEHPTSESKDGTTQAADNSINTEFQDAYKAISSSPWAARLGGFFGTVKKQSEQYYDTANKQATAGLTILKSHTRNISLTGDPSSSSSSSATPSSSKDAPPSTTTAEAHPDRPDSLPADIVKEAEGMLIRLRDSAAKRLADINKVEDAADEALLKFGTNIRTYLRDAVTIAPPSSSAGADPNEVLYESKDSAGKKVVHATRFDAQLHVIHSSLDSFLRDPVSPEWEDWRAKFDAESKTDEIARDLEQHGELRKAMERLVPERVEYGVFWARYYFLRHVIESEEQRRREMLKASAPTEDEEVAWDEDSSDSEEDEEEEEETAPTPSQTANKSVTSLAASKETLKPASSPAAVGPPAASLVAAVAPTTAASPPTADTTLKPTQPQPRRSNDEKSVADSDTSYDVVSGSTSRAPGSPQAQGLEKKKVVAAEESDEEESEEEDSEEEESDEEDWE